MISAFDTENESSGKFIFGVFKDERNIEVFNKAKQLRTFLKDVGGFTFANNLYYDFGNLYSERDFDPDIIEINSGRTVIRQGRFISLKYRGRPTYFYDLFNYLRSSIEQIGVWLGKPKMKFDPHNLDYCVRDTEITHIAVKQCLDFIEKQFDMKPKPTTASFSMAIYKKMGYPEIPTAKNMDYFNTGYFGGRTEAFYIGKKRMAVYDINSAYPFAMTKDIPFGEPFNTRKLPIRDTDFVKCVVKVPDLRYGLLPVKFGWGSLCFPIGTIEGSFWGKELLTAEKYGAEITQVKNITRYGNVGPYFKDFADMLYDLRLEHDDNPLLKKFIKLILNSFYGKQATKHIIQKIVIERNEKDIYYDDYIFKGGSGLGLAERDYGFTKTSRVDIAGYITAYVRSMLLEAIIDSSAFYCDTDSVFIRPVNRKVLSVSTALGAFKHEGTFDMNILGPKMYYSDCGKKIACKGVPKKFQLEAMKKGFMKTERPRSWLTAMKTGKQPNEWREFKKTVKAGGANRAGIFGFTDPFMMKGEICLNRQAN